MSHTLLDIMKAAGYSVKKNTSIGGFAPRQLVEQMVGLLSPQEQETFWSRTTLDKRTYHEERRSASAIVTTRRQLPFDCATCPKRVTEPPYFSKRVGNRTSHRRLYCMDCAKRLHLV